MVWGSPCTGVRNEIGVWASRTLDKGLRARQGALRAESLPQGWADLRLAVHALELGMRGVWGTLGGDKGELRARQGAWRADSLPQG